MRSRGLGVKLGSSALPGEWEVVSANLSTKKNWKDCGAQASNISVTWPLLRSMASWAHPRLPRQNPHVSGPGEAGMHRSTQKALAWLGTQRQHRESGSVILCACVGEQGCLSAWSPAHKPC